MLLGEALQDTLALVGLNIIEKQLFQFDWHAIRIGVYEFWPKGFRLGPVGIPLGLDRGKFLAKDHSSEQVVTSLEELDPASELLDPAQEHEAQAQIISPRDTTLNATTSLKQRGAGGVGGPGTTDIVQVLCRNIAGGREHVAVLLKLFYCGWVYGAVIPYKGISGLISGLSHVGDQDRLRFALDSSVDLHWALVEDSDHPVHAMTLTTGLAVKFFQNHQEAIGLSPNEPERRLSQPTVARAFLLSGFGFLKTPNVSDGLIRALDCDVNDGQEAHPRIVPRVLHPSITRRLRRCSPRASGRLARKCRSIGRPGTPYPPFGAQMPGRVYRIFTLPSQNNLMAYGPRYYGKIRLLQGTKVFFRRYSSIIRYRFRLVSHQNVAVLRRP